MAKACDQVWITGIGLISSLGEGAALHWNKLCGAGTLRPVIDPQRFAPYTVHPLADIDFSKQIPRTSDQRQMERWQRIGVYAAGLALADADIAGDQELLEKTHLCIAAGNGERDIALDSRILAGNHADGAQGAYLNQNLATGLRPTLYLGQLSNLLAGNISIVHKATGSSRTFKGEEMAGASAVADAVNRIEAGQGEVFLVGGALNAEREDVLLGCELAGSLYSGPHHSVWQRRPQGGGLVPGSVGAFLVLEAAEHARRRGVVPYARISGIVSDRSRRRVGEASSVAASLFKDLRLNPANEDIGVLSGASGVEPATSEELQFLAELERQKFKPVVRAWGSALGHSLEAHFFAGLALASLAVSNDAFYPPFDAFEDKGDAKSHPDRVLVTTFGHWRGEALALVQSAW
ncbi:beta-ketoacyl-ACP synthase [Hyphomicrobium sp. LHD-15]|uniref:beta-ketoacyl-ACP synthase n=1 Tax=Hyphomicrobium sp. LHD-15 TaxID=3072142 RepID=UPI0028103613|nr:beta-ketoacyl-ACP synthase [Hyphomicrobium sp. LHD-15]MDQ8698273.1 beta-ketoacyl-ACP synthase [Hyphomicrobium sp. LHD-15]